MKVLDDRAAGQPMMNAIRPDNRKGQLMLPVLLLMLMASHPGQGMAGAMDAGKKSQAPEWQLRSDLSIEHNDNVFRLSPSQAARLASPDPTDIANGRLADMNSISDNIVSAGLEVDYEFSGTKGSRKALNAELGYHHYLDNPAASYFDGDVALTWNAGKNDRVQAKGEFTTDRFRANYLHEINDVNANGNIPGDERRYASGIYSEIESSVAYRHRFEWSQPAQTHSSNQDLDAQIAVGGVYRDYANPFNNRDRKGFFGAIQFDLKLSPRLKVELAARHENITSPGNRETILLDETQLGFNRDMNGDGMIKANAPLLTPVDRSRKANTLRLESTLEFNDDWQAVVVYRHRQSEFTSSNPLDVDYYGGEETLQQMSAAIRWQFRKRWSIGCQYERTLGDDFEDLGRNDEEYRQESISLALQHRFQ